MISQWDIVNLRFIADTTKGSIARGAIYGEEIGSNPLSFNKLMIDASIKLFSKWVYTQLTLRLFYFPELGEKKEIFME